MTVHVLDQCWFVSWLNVYLLNKIMLCKHILTVVSHSAQHCRCKSCLPAGPTYFFKLQARSSKVVDLGAKGRCWNRTLTLVCDGRLSSDDLKIMLQCLRLSWGVSENQLKNICIFSVENSPDTLCCLDIRNGMDIVYSQYSDQLVNSIWPGDVVCRHNTSALNLVLAWRLFGNNLNNYRINVSGTQWNFNGLQWNFNQYKHSLVKKCVK